LAKIEGQPPVIESRAQSRCRGGCANRLFLRAVERPRQTSPLQLLGSLLVLFSTCGNLPDLRIQNTCLFCYVFHNPRQACLDNSKPLGLSVLEVLNVFFRELRVRATDAVIQIRQCFWTYQCKCWKRLVDKVANHDLTNRIAVFLLEAAYPLETVSIFLMIKENSDAGIRGNLVEFVLFEPSKVAARLAQIGKRGKAVLNVPLHE